MAIFHAYKFTHFGNNNESKTKSAGQLTTGQKIQTIFFGVNNPRPTNNIFPSQHYETIKLKSNREIECWYIHAKNPKGTIILFHGFGGSKASLLGKSDLFLNMGYNTLLVDFMGSGGSEGNQTTIGFLEAEQVKTSFDFIAKKTDDNVYLFGTSMGAVAIMKAIKDFKLTPKGIILECPFGTMYQTVCARFNTMRVHTFPMAGLLMFWGGVENGFWAFGHNPKDYAKNITCPTLLLYGEQDEKVSREEINEIFSNLRGIKQLKTYPLAGHENYLARYKSEWIKDIAGFL